ncbi:hypothetical protein Cus16_2948 [Curtobacterium sp. ER1/6]|nr:hypothetical protein Cus16_2948 [Curtobacterium sp. ER1/6]
MTCPVVRSVRAGRLLLTDDGTRRGLAGRGAPDDVAQREPRCGPEQRVHLAELAHDALGQGTGAVRGHHGELVDVPHRSGELAGDARQRLDGLDAEDGLGVLRECVGLGLRRVGLGLTLGADRVGGGLALGTGGVGRQLAGSCLGLRLGGDGLGRDAAGLGLGAGGLDLCGRGGLGLDPGLPRVRLGHGGDLGLELGTTELGSLLRGDLLLLDDALGRPGLGERAGGSGLGGGTVGVELQRGTTDGQGVLGLGDRLVRGGPGLTCLAVGLRLGVLGLEPHAGTLGPTEVADVVVAVGDALDLERVDVEPLAVQGVLRNVEHRDRELVAVADDRRHVGGTDRGAERSGEDLPCEVVDLLLLPEEALRRRADRRVGLAHLDERHGLDVDRDAAGVLGVHVDVDRPRGQRDLRHPLEERPDEHTRAEHDLDAGLHRLGAVWVLDLAGPLAGDDERLVRPGVAVDELGVHEHDDGEDDDPHDDERDGAEREQDFHGDSPERARHGRS